ncbi:MAG: EamA family transporter [Muribaculaceae bacterium]|nr:EamA family transporter [Muribaculaceae bacterium]
MPSTEGNRTYGHLAMLMATIMWGAMAPIAKSVLEQGVLDGLALSVVRIGGGAILFLLFSFLPKRITGDVKVDRKDYFTLFLASVVMISSNQGLFIIGIQYTTPVDTSVMCTLTPVFTLLLAAIFIGNPLTPLKVLGVVLGLTGALLMAFSNEEAEIAVNPMLGNLLCMMAQICASVYYVFFLKLINKYPAFTIMKWMFIFSALTYIPGISLFIPPIQWMELETSSIMGLAYIILFPTFLAYLIIPYSQKLLKPTVISTYAYLQPVVASLLATIMGLALFGWNRIFATALIFLGVFLVSFSMRPKRESIRLKSPQSSN